MADKEREQATAVSVGDGERSGDDDADGDKRPWPLVVADSRNKTCNLRLPVWADPSRTRGDLIRAWSMFLL